jgi:drug/metabolite transporter (DMT)-like permease
MGISTTADATPPSRFAFPALVLSNIVLAVGPLLVRMSDTGPVAAGFWRLLLAVPILFLMMRASGQSLGGLAPVLSSMILVGGLLFAADLASWHLGIMRTKVANSTLFANISTLILPIWGIFVLRQRPARLQVVALILAAIGIIMLMGSSYELSPRYLTGDLLSLFAGVTYAGYIIVLQRVRLVLGNWAILTVSSAASAPPVLLMALALGENIMPANWTPLIILALSSQVVGQGLLIYALGWLSPLIIGLTLLLQPLIAATLGWIVYGETFNMADIIGAVAVAAALVLVRLPTRT